MALLMSRGGIVASGFVDEGLACGDGDESCGHESTSREGREGCVNVGLVSIQNLVYVEMKYICVRIAMIFPPFCSHKTRYPSAAAAAAAAPVVHRRWSPSLPLRYLTGG